MDLFLGQQEDSRGSKTKSDYQCARHRASFFLSNLAPFFNERIYTISKSIKENRTSSSRINRERIPVVSRIDWIVREANGRAGISSDWRGGYKRKKMSFPFSSPPLKYVIIYIWRKRRLGGVKIWYAGLKRAFFPIRIISSCWRTGAFSSSWRVFSPLFILAIQFAAAWMAFDWTNGTSGTTIEPTHREGSAHKNLIIVSRARKWETSREKK